MPILPSKSPRGPKKVPRPSRSVTTTGGSETGRTGAQRPKNARDIMLDPHGIYGTRTASRLASMKRRRNTQTMLVGGALLLAAGAYGARLLLRGGTALPPQQTIALPGPPATAPIAVEGVRERALLVALQSGSLWSVAPGDGHKIPARSRRVWATGFPASAPPLAQGDTVYLPGADRFLRAVNWRRGKGLWGLRMAGTPVTPPLLLQTPTVGAADPIPAASGSAAPLADMTAPPASGSAAPLAGMTAPPASAPRPARVAQMVVEGDDQGNVVACDAATGRVLWRRALPGPVGEGLRSATPDAGAGQPQVILVPVLSGAARQGGLVCLEAQTGAVLWRYGLTVAAGASQYTAPQVVGSGANARVVCADDNGSLIALALRDGQKVWGQKAFLRPQTGATRDQIILPRGAPTAWVGTSDSGSLVGRVAVGGNDGWLRAYDTAQGRTLWTFDAGAPLFQPAVPWLRPARGGEPARERLLVAPQAPVLWLLDAARGTPEAQFALDAPASGPPLVLNDQAFVLTRSGKILRFPLS